jgi:hypothetical protein
MKVKALSALAYATLLVGSAVTYAEPPTTRPGDRASSSADVAEPERSERQIERRARRAFDEIDAERHGYLTSEDVKGDDWLIQNFERCNVGHDGHMRREEYDSCRE